MKRITAIARRANTAMAAPKISHSHQSARRPAILCRNDIWCDEAVLSRGVVESVLPSPTLSSFGINIATGDL